MSKNGILRTHQLTDWANLVLPISSPTEELPALALHRRVESISKIIVNFYHPVVIGNDAVTDGD